MREILFKAKRTDNKEWVEGFYLEIDSISYILPTGKHLHDIVQVDPETVCRYTGSTDMNGKKIFEWDIMLYRYLTPSNLRATKKYVVQWTDNGFHLFDGDFGFNPENLEVIGNIHDKED